jgi:hypothetical protein
MKFSLHGPAPDRFIILPVQFLNVLFVQVWNTHLSAPFWENNAPKAVVHFDKEVHRPMGRSSFGDPIAKDGDPLPPWQLTKQWLFAPWHIQARLK